MTGHSLSTTHGRKKQRSLMAGELVRSSKSLIVRIKDMMRGKKS
jgi:hypothetical protein